MASLYFHIGADFDNIIRLKKEIKEIEKEIRSFDASFDSKGLKVLETKLQIAKREFDTLAVAAVKAGAQLEYDFKKSASALLAAQHNVDQVTARLIEQKAVVSTLQSEVRLLNLAYGNSDNKADSLLQVNEKKNELEKERFSLTALQKEQSMAKLTVKGLKDEFQAYEKTLKEGTIVQDEHSVSFTKMLAKLGGVTALTKFASDVVRVRGEFQQLDVAFTTLLQSKEKANELMTQLINTAAKTPFSLTEVATGARQLIAYGFASEDVNETLIRLGNVASGLGLPLERLTYLYGTTMTQGRLYARDLMQFTTSGIPMLQGLADMYGVSTEEVNKMVSAGKIGFPQVQQVIENMTNEGGKFFNLMEEQSKTVTGKISNLGDSWDDMLNKIGKSQDGLINGSLDGLKFLIDNYEELLGITVSLIAGYGSYRAAMMTVAAIQNTVKASTIAMTTAEAAHIIVTKQLTKATELLKVAQLALPYVAVAAAVTGLVYVLYKLVTAESAAEKAQREYSERKKGIIEQEKIHKDKINELIDAATNQYLADTERIKALEMLKDEYPEIFKKYDIEKLKLADILEIKKQIAEADRNRIIQDRENYANYLRTSIRTGYGIKENYLKNNPDSNLSNTPDIYKIKLSKSNIEEYNEKLKEIEKEEQLDRVNQWIGNLKNLTDKQIQAELTARTRLSDSLKNKKNKGEIINSDGSVLGIFTAEEIKSQTDNLTIELDKRNQAVYTYVELEKKYQKELSDAQAKLKQLETDKSKYNEEDWKEKVKEAKEKEKTAKEALSSFSVKDKNADKLLKTQTDLSRSILENELKLQAERTAIDEDGKAKRIALSKQETRDTIAAIQKEKQEYQAMVKETKEKEDPTVIKTFDDREAVAKAKEQADIARIEKEYAEEYKQRTKALTDVFLNEEQRKTNAIKDRYAKERTWADEQLATGSMTKEEHKSYTANIDQSEMKENYNSLLDGLNDYKQQEAELTATWKARISEAEKTGDADLIERMKAGRDKALSTLNSQMLQESAEWMRLFGNLDTLTVDELNNLIDSIQKQLDSGTLTLNPVDAKALMDSLNEAKETVAEKSPFQALAKSSGEMKTALAELKQAEDNGLTGEALDKYKNNVKNSAENVKKSINAIGDAYGQVSDVMRSAADLISMVDEGVGETINNALSLGDAVMNVGQVVANAVVSFAAGMSTMETASVILLIIKAVILAVMAALALFNGDKKHEKKIKEMQDQVDDLERSYDKLGRAVEKAYSQDAADIIGQQNDNLEKQNELLRQQIAEEEAKKKTDKDKIKEWQNAIDDNNQRIEENKEKAVDAIFGADIKGAIDDLASAYADAWAAGEDRAKAMKDVVKKMINGVIIEMLKSDLAPTVALLREKIKQAIADGIITDTEQAEIDALVNGAVADADKKYAPLDKYLKGDLSESDLLGSSSDSLADSIIEGLKAGKSGIKEFSDSFEDMMKTAILNSLKTKYLEGPLKEFYKKFAEMSESGGQLTEAEIEELRNMYANIIDGAKVQFDGMKDIAGLDFTADSDNSLKGAYAKASQESIDLLAGQTGAQRVVLENIREHMQFIRDIQFQGWQDVKAIRDLSGKIADNTKQIEQNSRQLNDIAGKIETNTSKTFSALDGAINVKVKM